MTPALDHRRQALLVLTAYLGFALLAATWRVGHGNGSWVVVAGYLLLGAVTIGALRGQGRAWTVMGQWLPLLALPALYSSIPATALVQDGGMYDAIVQAWDRQLFGTDAARTLAGAMPSLVLSEVLHAAYLSYYAIIYLPPGLMFAGGDDEAFGRTVLAFTLAMTACLAAFCVFPVEGPRYAWPAPAGVPEGPVRRVVLAVLEGGSARGTAFPSSHLAIALAMGLSSLRWQRGLGVVVLVLAGLLGLGAVYGGFHYAVDMLAGGAVGVAAGAAAWRGWRGKRKVASG